MTRQPLSRFARRLSALATAVAAVIAIGVLTAGSASAYDGNFVTGRYFWAQGQATVTMRPANTDVCVLTLVTGHFRGGGESVRVYQRGGYWRLGGTSEANEVAAGATCFNMSAFRTSHGQARWLSPELGVNWTNGGDCENHKANAWWGDAATYLSGIGGDFAGLGEYGHITQSGSGFGPSIIEGNACQEDDAYSIRAHSFFAGKPSSGKLAVFIGPDDSAGPGDGDQRLFGERAFGGPAYGTHVMARVNDAMCYLTGMHGKFRGQGEFVRIVPRVVANAERWVLEVQNEQDEGDVVGFAKCYARNQG